MILIKPSHQIITEINSEEIIKRIEAAGRTCYKSEQKITAVSASQFVYNIIKSGHESVIEHENISVRFICDRGVTHELVRHRLCAFSQESTRYCNYGKAENGVTFVIPPWVDICEGRYESHEIDEVENDARTRTWWYACIQAENNYLTLLKLGWTPQQARSVLPNSLKTEIVVTANIREWRHIMKLRTSKVAHPQMKELMNPLLLELKEKLPVLFKDIVSE